jgi:hypothetical protein
MSSSRTGFPVWFTVLFSLGVAVCWWFPRFWYTRSGDAQKPFWLTERTNVAGWNYRELPVAESAERMLVADRLVSGEFSQAPGELVQVFSAKRYSDQQNDIGLFAHTPDRCWTESGWKLESTLPDWVERTIHGHKMVFERRLFTNPTRRELVYFGGLVGGAPLPYRLDHNLSVGIKYTLRATKDKTGSALRAADKLFWQRVWESFASRRPLLGPKQFLRISTAVVGDDLSGADRRLTEFLAQWLTPVDYRQELDSWKSSKTQGRP